MLRSYHLAANVAKDVGHACWFDTTCYSTEPNITLDMNAMEAMDAMDGKHPERASSHSLPRRLAIAPRLCAQYEDSMP